jgi:hypothetical protein
MNSNELFEQMLAAGRGLVGDVWAQMQTYAVPELKKIAIQIEAIAENFEDYSPEGAKILFDMQVKAAIGVIVAMTTLTMLAVQNALNAILAAVSDFVNAALPFPLI